MTNATLSQTAIDVILANGPALGLRVPVILTPPGLPTRACSWTPDLTAAEQTILSRIQALSRAAVPGISPAEWEQLEPFFATGRLFVQQSQAQYTALTQAQINRMNFDNITALWRVIFRLLRDS